MRTYLKLAAGLFLISGTLLPSAPLLAHPGDHDESTLPWQHATAWPDRIIVTIDGDPATTLSVNWRTDKTVTTTRAEIALARPDARFDKEARSLDAETQALDLSIAAGRGHPYNAGVNEGLPTTHHHSVKFEGIEPDTLYAYRVQGGDGKWSEWFQTRTAARKGPIKFVYLGDAQNNLGSHWPRVIREAFRTAPDARFVLHAGDMVNRGSRDLEWANWFKAGGFIHGMIPVIGVAGNHEYDDFGITDQDKEDLLSILWRPQFRFTPQPDLSAKLQETVYSVRYGDDLEVFVLNSNIKDMSEQADWLDAKLTSNTARWRVVTMHHPIFSSGRGRDNEGRRELLLPVLLKHKVDLVLQGHDHTYARGSIAAPVQTPARQAATSDGGVTTMFVNSVSGPKMYEFNEDGWDSYAPSGVKLTRKGENTQFFQVITVDEGTLSYKAHTADGELYDAFELTKTGGDAKTLTNAQELPEERLFSNTIPYSRIEEK